MLLFFLLLCCAALGGSFTPNVAPPASRCALGRHDAGRCHVSRAWRASPCSASRASSGARRGFAISREISVRADDGGRGDTPGEKSAIAAAEAKIEAVEGEIRAVGQKIEKVEAALSGGPPYLGISDPDLLRDDLKQLRDDLKQLRKEKEQLRELMLRQLPAQASFLTPVSENLTEFGAALTRAVVTDSTLELADGTSFLGEATLGSKVFIRQCYNDFSKSILHGGSSGTKRNFVVTGTPGIGKSVFGFYFLYLLRCQGKTVVYENKRRWYRFSDAGVTEGRYDSFVDAGYLNDVDSWYLSDPDDRPFEGFSGSTVVLVSPKKKRVHEFLKQALSERLFMPVWSLDELLRCRRDVLSHVPITDVEKAFTQVGGVARVIFGATDLELYKRTMKKVARTLDLAVLRGALSSSNSDAFTDSTSDVLFHICPSPEKAFRDFTIEFASDFAIDLVADSAKRKGKGEFECLMTDILGNEEYRKSLGGSTTGRAFEVAAHVAIGEPGDDERTFDMTILSNIGKDILNGETLSFDFAKRESFEGQAIPDALHCGIYYSPINQNFAGIDSFGVDSSGDTLFFFQMKSTGVQAVNGAIVGRYLKAVKKSEGVSIKKYVFVHVVPKDCTGVTKTIKADWLKIQEVPVEKEESDNFRSQCCACIIEMSWVVGRKQRSGVAVPPAGTGSSEQV